MPDDGQQGAEGAQGQANGQQASGEQGQQAQPTWRDGLTRTVKLGDKEVPLKEHKSLARYATVDDLAQGYVNLEKLQGQGVKVPGEGATAEEIARYRRTLGVPETADGYDLGKPQLGGVDLPPEMLNHFKGVFHKHGLPPAQAVGVLNDYVQWMEATKAAQQDAYDQAVEGYRKEIGEVRYTRELANAHAFVKEYLDEATQADLHRLGLDFHLGLLKGLAKAGSQLAEAEYITGDVPGQPSKEDAQAEWDRIGRDPAFLKGDPKLVERRDDLARRIWGVKEVA